MQQHYGTLVIGATAAGIGYAAAHDDSLLIERGISPAYEFVDACNPGNGYAAPQSTLAKSIYDEMISRNALLDGRVHLPAFTPVLLERMKRFVSRISLMTEIIAIKTVNVGFEVTLSNVDGESTIRFDRILDTTSERISREGFSAAGRSIGAILDSASGADRAGSYGTATVTAGRFASEAFLSLPLDANDDWAKAREKLFAFWRTRDDRLKDWQIVVSASAFTYALSANAATVEKNWLHLPSAAHKNPLAAIEAGERFSFGAAQ